MPIDIESPEARNLRLNAKAANEAHAEGRHGPGAAPTDIRVWAAMGCRECAAHPTAHVRRRRAS